MSISAEQFRVGSFACVFGNRERLPESIERFDEICSARGLSLSLAKMGCKTFWQMTEPVESYIYQCISDTLAISGLLAKDINRIVFTTMDKNVRYLDENFVCNILNHLGLVNSIPIFISMQQCASSLAALKYSCGLFVDENVEHVLMVAFDFVIDDRDRIQSYALFGDAVTSCVVTRDATKGLSVSACGVNLDFTGLLGKDDFGSRKSVAKNTLKTVFDKGNASIAEIEYCFSTNFYKPIATFNASVCGIHSSKLFIETLSSRAHCGNCDWMMNLSYYEQHTGFELGKKYLVQSYAPGFFACSLLTT